MELIMGIKRLKSTKAMDKSKNFIQMITDAKSPTKQVKNSDEKIRLLENRIEILENIIKERL
jgi:hypothetical protein